MRTTIKLTELRSEAAYLAKLKRYAWKRYINAWANRNRLFAATAFTAADRVERLERLIAR